MHQAAGSSLMTCRQCQATIHPGRRFCFNCGAALVVTCLACGHPNQSTDRFCAGCGQPVTSSPPAAVPDHMHFAIAHSAIQKGKHVYCQKPLTHTVFEARLMAESARQHKVATQMGNQGHCNPETRRLVELIQAGVLGKVSAIHVWTDRPGNWWPTRSEHLARNRSPSTATRSTRR